MSSRQATDGVLGGQHFAVQCSEGHTFTVKRGTPPPKRCPFVKRGSPCRGEVLAPNAKKPPAQ